MDSGLSWGEELECALRALATLLRDEKTISWYEVHMSRLVPVLLHCLTGKGEGSSSNGGERGVADVSREEKANTRVKLFKKVFLEALDDLAPDLDSRYFPRQYIILMPVCQWHYWCDMV